ncbi:MAG: small multi-drug export protein [bacterium]
MLNINYIQLFKCIPPEVSTMIIAMLPIAELRVAIPVALGGYRLSVFSAYFWSVLGNMIPAVFILKYIDPFSTWISKKSSIMKIFFDWLFARTRRKIDGNFQKYGAMALVIFVAIPLPMTGAWSGSLAAFLLGINSKKAFFLILAGVLIAGIIVTIATKFGMFGVRLIGSQG